MRAFEIFSFAGRIRAYRNHFRTRESKFVEGMVARSSYIRLFCFALLAIGSAPHAPGQQIELNLPAGAPLQLSIENRVSLKNVGQPVTARLLTPLFAFNTEVAPANSLVFGHVDRLNPVSRQRRILSIMNGDFTPLRDPQIRFDTLQLPSGQTMALRTALTSGRSGVFHAESPVAPKTTSNQSAVGRVKQELKEKWDSERQELIKTIHDPHKWERLQEAGYARLPYHPQYLQAGTRVSTELEQPIPFGNQALSPKETALMGTFPRDAVVDAHLISTLSSATSLMGAKVEAIVSRPYYSPEGQLLLPEGTRLTGSVMRVSAARWWRRGGELRFAFQKVQLPESVNAADHEFQAEAVLAGVDAMRSGAVRIDSEGVIKSFEPMTRFLAPAAKLFLGAQVLDNDSRSNGQPTSANRTMRVLAGASGFGVLGSVAGQFSHAAATSLGFYGAAWSVFSHVVERGHEVVIDPDTPIQIRFETAR